MSNSSEAKDRAFDGAALRYLEGLASADDVALLNSELANDSARREAFVALSCRETALSQLLCASRIGEVFEDEELLEGPAEGSKHRAATTPKPTGPRKGSARQARSRSARNVRSRPSARQARAGSRAPLATLGVVAALLLGVLLLALSASDRGRTLPTPSSSQAQPSETPRRSARATPTPRASPRASRTPSPNPEPSSTPLARPSEAPTPSETPAPSKPSGEDLNRGSSPDPTPGGLAEGPLVEASPSPAPEGPTRVEAIARLERVDGELSVLLDGQRTQAKRDAEVLPGSELVVAQGAALLVFPDATRVRLWPGARVRVVSPQRLEVQAGQVFAVVRPQPKGSPFEVETPGAKVVVLGTRFAVRVEADRTRVELERGTLRVVNLRTKSRKKLSAGRWAEVRGRSLRTGRIKLPPLRKLSLVDIRTGEPVPAYDPLCEGDVIDPARVPLDQVTLVAVGEGVARIDFFHNGNRSWTEKTPPYSFSGDLDGKLNAWQLKAGAHEVRAAAFSDEAGKLSLGDPLVVRFRIGAP